MELVFLIGWCIVGIFEPVIINRLKPRLLHSVRFIAAYITILLMGIAVILWVATKDIDIFLVCALVSVWGGLQMLLLPKTAPGIADKFDLKW